MSIHESEIVRGYAEAIGDKPTPEQWQFIKDNDKLTISFPLASL